MPLLLAAGFETSARLACDLAGRREVAACWAHESACAGMTVGGLANHLVAQVGNAVAILGGTPSEQLPIPLAEHYRRAAWVHTDLDEDANRSILDGANGEATSGPEGLADRIAAGLTGLPAALDHAADARPDSWLIPWQGWALSAQDLMTTRLMELVVHSDDLAASLGVDTPEFPDDVVTAVLGLLTTVAVERHGQTAVVRSLARPQRVTGPVSAFGG